MSKTTILEIGPEEKRRMLRELRRGRFGYLLGVHIVLLSAAGHSPSAIAEVLFCSRTSVYRAVRAYREGALDESVEDESKVVELGAAAASSRGAAGPSAALRRTLLSLLELGPQALGWCRTRWSCATLALELEAKHHLAVSAETVRRWLHELGWVWKRAKLIARDDDPERAEKLARIRSVYETVHQLGPTGKRVMLFADELDVHLLPKVGYEWTRKGQQTEVWTPGKNEKAYLAGALNAFSGQVHQTLGQRKNSSLFLKLLEDLEQAYAPEHFEQIHVVVDNYGIHKSKAVERWLEAHRRFELLFLPSYCPKANPIERLFGDIHDHCTRNHKRKRLGHLLADVLRFIHDHGSWLYEISDIYFEADVDAAMPSTTLNVPAENAA
jgi:transposase